MTDTDTDQTPDPEPREPDEQDITLEEKHRQFKLRLASELCRWANDRNHCSAFDEVINHVGLPARYDLVDHVLSEDFDLVGERTEEEFARWCRETEQFFWDQADHYGVGDRRFDQILEQCGLHGRPRKVVKEVVVEGTFRIPMGTVEVREGADVIDQVEERVVLGRLRYHQDYVGSEFNWKATVVSERTLDYDD